MALKVALLDVDGTLVASNDLHVEAWREAFHRFGKDVPRQALRNLMGMGGDRIVAHLLDADEAKRFGWQVEDAHVEIFVKEYQPREQVLPGVRPLLERLKANGLRVVLASSARKVELDGHLRILSIDDLLDACTTSDDADRSKPSPDIFEAALDGADPKEAFVLGDSPWDAEAAGKAGLAMIGVLTGGFPAEALLQRGARVVYADLVEVLEYAPPCRASDPSTM